MVICDLCKNKIADRAHLVDKFNECKLCGAELCNKCVIEVGIETFCPSHTPKCTGCQSPLTKNAIGCAICGETFHSSCVFRAKTTKDPNSWWLCKTHYDEYEARYSEAMTIIDYAAKLFKCLGIPPLKISRNISLECNKAEFKKAELAEFRLKNEWSAIVTYPMPSAIDIVVQGLGFGTKIRVSTYNHEEAVSLLREKLIKLLLHHKRTVSSKFSDIIPLGGQERIDYKNRLLSLSRVNELLKIITASKDAPVQD